LSFFVQLQGEFLDSRAMKLTYASGVYTTRGDESFAEKIALRVTDIADKM